MGVRMRPEYNGHGVEQAEDDAEFDRVPQVDGQLATRVHGRKTVSGNFEQTLFYFFCFRQLYLIDYF
jgi:hypothetical protein